MPSFRQVHIVGMGPGTSALMTLEAKALVEAADLVVGAPRLLEGLALDGGTQAASAITSSDICAALASHPGFSCAVVAMSGDIGMFSGARGLAARLRAELGEGVEVTSTPGISSMQCLAAALDRPWQGWRFRSAHGVALDIVREVRRGGELFCVTGGAGNSVAQICARLAEAGLGDVQVSAGERLGYPEQRVVRSCARDLAQEDFDSLSVILVDCPERDAEVSWPWATAGIADELFVRGKVPMTKQEVRALAVSKLKVREGDVIWDIGAGTGSVSVECALLSRTGEVVAVERKPEACELTRENARRFGAGNVRVVPGAAPEALDGAPAPDAVFVGGSTGALAGVLDRARALNPRVRVCVSAITVETLAQATELLAGEGWEGFEVVQVQASRADKLGRYHLMRAQNPVFLMSAQAAGEVGAGEATDE